MQLWVRGRWARLGSPPLKSGEAPVQGAKPHTGTVSWSADALFSDQDGLPTVVEVKRADNCELRRDVVGQVLDYAAGLRYGDPERIRREFESA